MNLKRLEKLINYRRRLESLARAALASAIQSLDGIESRRYAEIARREQEEERILEIPVATAHELKSRHDHLAKIGETIAILDDQAGHAADEVEKRRDALIEARRQVKLLELAAARDRQRAEVETRRRSQTVSDDFAARAHHLRQQSDEHQNG